MVTHPPSFLTSFKSSSKRTIFLSFFLLYFTFSMKIAKKNVKY